MQDLGSGGSGGGDGDGGCDGRARRRGLAHALLSAVDGDDDDDDRKQNSAVTSNNVKMAIVNLLIGGSTSSTNYIYLLVNVLAQNPDVQVYTLYSASHPTPGSLNQVSAAIDRESGFYEF